MASTTVQFNGGGLTFNNVQISASTTGYSTVITGNNTFNVVSSNLSASTTLTLPAGGTQTVSNWTATGSSGKILTINSSTAGTQSTIIKSGAGVISTINYLSVKDSLVTPGSIWYAGANSTDAGNNTEWTFGTYIPSTGNFLMLFI